MFDSLLQWWLQNQHVGAVLGETLYNNFFFFFFTKLHLSQFQPCYNGHLLQPPILCLPKVDLWLVTMSITSLLIRENEHMKKEKNKWNCKGAYWSCHRIKSCYFFHIFSCAELCPFCELRPLWKWGRQQMLFFL